MKPGKADCSAKTGQTSVVSNRFCGPGSAMKAAWLFQRVLQKHFSAAAALFNE
jgi:hypothetical protein